LTFQKVPFVYITSFFLLGIVFIDNTVYGSENALISLFMALSIYILLSKVKNEFLKKIRVGLLFLAILFTGGSLISFNRTESKSITKGTSVLLSVDEIASEDKDWRKAICTVNSLVTKDSVVNLVEKILLFFNS